MAAAELFRRTGPSFMEVLEGFGTVGGDGEAFAWRADIFSGDSCGASPVTLFLWAVGEVGPASAAIMATNSSASAAEKSLGDHVLRFLRLAGDPAGDLDDAFGRTGDSSPTPDELPVDFFLFFFSASFSIAAALIAPLLDNRRLKQLLVYSSYMMIEKICKCWTKEVRTTCGWIF